MFKPRFTNWSRHASKAGSPCVIKRKTTLAYEEIVALPPVISDQPRLGIFVHGMLGLGRNWRSFARTLAKQAANESGR